MRRRPATALIDAYLDVVHLAGAVPTVGPEAHIGPGCGGCAAWAKARGADRSAPRSSRAETST
jgi:hypothetical protein